MRHPAALLIVLLLTPQGLLATPADAAPDGTDDCDTGGDAPNAKGSAVTIWLHICDGALVSGDTRDWLRIDVSYSVGYEMRADPGVTLCLWFSGDGSPTYCEAGYSTALIFSNQPFYFELRGGGVYNLTFRADKPPSLRSWSCSPAPQEAGESFSCALTAYAETDGVQYAVDWRDGTPVAWTSFMWPTQPMIVTHTYASGGEKFPTVIVRDSGSFGPNGPFRGQLQSSPLGKPLHVREQGADSFFSSEQYSAGTGDALCLENQGCVVYTTVDGEQSVDIKVRDVTGLPVGGMACSTYDCASGPKVAFCGEASLPLTGHDERVRVMLDEVRGPLDCSPEIRLNGSRLGPAVAGTVEATFR